MRASRMHIVTLRDDPADAEIASHKLLTRAGFIHKTGAGLYLYGPLLKRVIDKIGRIVAEEIAATGALEITMPILQERSLWERSGRWQAYQKTRTMLTVTDRSDQQFGLAPTAEEVVTAYAAQQIGSYKQLPVCWFQQHTKFRDEIRPRFGLMRVKEFIMMDAYSFHADETSLDATYEDMRQAYVRLFRRMGLEALAVEADSGAIGGSGSHEFMIAADVGEDTILVCEASGYAANVERAVGRIAAAPAWQAPGEATEIATPGQTSIDEVVAFLRQEGHADVQPAHFCKMVLFQADTDAGVRTVAAGVRGDRVVNEVKLLNAANRALSEAGAVHQLLPLGDAAVQQATGAAPGFAGPLPSLQVDVCIMDPTLLEVGPLVIGGNRTDHHVLGFDPQRDAHCDWLVEDITTIVAGDADVASGEPLVERRGIEAGHIFKLGCKYSTPMGAQFTGQDGKLHDCTMGCYGIGTSRVAAAAVEQHHDGNGICWPIAIAPYHCVVVPTRADQEPIADAARQIYERLLAAGIEVVLDDRDLKPGVKFKDWDLIGLPLRIVVGRDIGDGIVEFKPRDGDMQKVGIDDAVDAVTTRVREALVRH